MVRGFIPDGLRSSPETSEYGCLKLRGPLRAPSGINPLATEAHLPHMLACLLRSLHASSFAITPPPSASPISCSAPALVAMMYVTRSASLRGSSNNSAGSCASPVNLMPSFSLALFSSSPARWSKLTEPPTFLLLSRQPNMSSGSRFDTGTHHSASRYDYPLLGEASDATF